MLFRTNVRLSDAVHTTIDLKKEYDMKTFLTWVAVTVLVGATLAFGKGSYVSKVPNGGVFSCDTCHKEKKMYVDFENNGLKWDETLAAKDSDGDGYSNGIELQDPYGKWREKQPDPKRPGWSTYNPDDSKSVPPYHAVEPTSWGRVKALYK
jgi:hypothetical protein